MFSTKSTAVILAVRSTYKSWRNHTDNNYMENNHRKEEPTPGMIVIKAHKTSIGILVLKLLF